MAGRVERKDKKRKKKFWSPSLDSKHLSDEKKQQIDNNEDVFYLNEWNYGIAQYIPLVAVAD